MALIDPKHFTQIAIGINFGTLFPTIFCKLGFVSQDACVLTIQDVIQLTVDHLRLNPYFELNKLLKHFINANVTF